MQLLAEINALWCKQQELCEEHKERLFGKTARKIWQFYGKDYREPDPAIDGEGETLPDDLGPLVKPRLNMTRAFAAVMLPFIHQSMPERRASPRIPELPDELKALYPTSGPKTEHQLASWLLTYVLNYLTNEYDLEGEAWLVGLEALVKGRGVGWHELAEGVSGVIPVTTYDSVNNLFIDPDCCRWRNAGYIIRRRVQSVWQAAKRWEIDHERLRGSWRSSFSKGRYPDIDEQIGEDQRDVCVYYEVFSRMGIGENLRDASGETKELAQQLATLGPNIFLACIPGMEYPLNLPPEVVETATTDELRRRLEWSIAFHEEPSNPWPMTPLDFAPNVNDPWATSLLEGGLPLQVFIDRAYTLIMARMKTNSKELLFIAKKLEEAAKEAFLDQSGVPVIAVEGEPGIDIPKLVHQVQFQPLNIDIWKIIQIAERRFEDVTAMTPLMTGGEMERQIRSSSEYQGRAEAAMSRPQAYRATMLKWHKDVAAKDAQALRLYCGPDTIAPMFGEPVPNTDDPNWVALSPLAAAWSQMLNTDDPREAAADFLYSIAVGAGQAKNRQKLRADAQMLSQTFGPFFMQLAGSGMAEPFNRLMGILSEALEMPLDKLMLRPLQMQMQAQQQQQQQQQPQPQQGQQPPNPQEASNAGL